MPSPYLSHKAARRPRRLDTRKGFVFYFSWLDNLSYLSSDERNAVVLAIVDYARTLQPPTHLSPQAMVAFAFCRDIILHEAERFVGLEEATPSETEVPRKTAKNQAKSTPTEAKENNSQETNKNTPSTPENQSLPSSTTPASSEPPSATPPAIPLSPENQSSAVPSRTRDSNNNINTNINTNTEKNTSSSSPAEAKAKGEGFSAISGRMRQGVVAAYAQPTLSEVEALWQERGYRSNAQEFYDYNEQRGWFTKEGSRICRWKTAAQNWERRYCEIIAPLRERAAQQQAVETLRQQNRAAGAAYRREQQQQREREARQSRLLAVSHEEAQARFAEALTACGGDTERAIAMLKAHDMARLAELERTAGGAALP